jgi:hypothetical protein
VQKQGIAHLLAPGQIKEFLQSQSNRQNSRCCTASLKAIAQPFLRVEFALLVVELQGQLIAFSDL